MMKFVWRFTLACSMATGAVAAEYPSKPVALVVPYAAGGATDALARALGAEMGKSLNQTVVVENKLGAGGAIAAGYVARAAADGYTVCLCGTGNLVTNPLINKTAYDPFKDLLPVVYVADMPNVLVARKGLSASDIAALRKDPKTMDGALTFGTSGVAGTHHLAGEWFAQKTDIQLTHVPYKGEAPAITDLVGGRIDLVFGTVSGTMSMIKSGDLQALAVLSDTRSQILPDVPTITEFGVPNYAAFNWVGLNVPTGTPSAAIARLNQSVNDALASPKFRERLEQFMMEGRGGTSAKYAAFMTAEHDKWLEVIRTVGIQAAQ